MPTTTNNAITAEGLVKVYRSRKSEVRALDGLDLEVAEGTVLVGASADDPADRPPQRWKPSRAGSPRVQLARPGKVFGLFRAQIV